MSLEDLLGGPGCQCLARVRRVRPADAVSERRVVRDEQTVSIHTPQNLTGFQATIARLVVGAGSALAVFFFVRSELFTVGDGTGMAQGPFLIAVAFAAGYSQRLVHATVESVAGMAESEESGDREP